MSAWLWLALACTEDAKTDPDGAPGPTDTGTGTGDTGCREALAEGFVDEDGDGFGDPARPVSCDPAAVAEGTDCDDTNPEIRPGLAERCDGIDNDCDPATPEEGLVTRVDASGASFDETPVFSAGSIGNPAVVELQSGRYDLCGGTHYARLRGIGVDAVLDGHGSAVLDADRSGSVVALDGGTFSATGLTLTGGLGSIPVAAGGDLTGGGIACFGEATVTLDGVTLVANQAFIGGAVFSKDCTVDVVATTLDGNQATYGGGLYALGGTATFTDSFVTNNIANNSGGGIGLEGIGPRPVLVLRDTLVADNLAAFGGGLAVYENSDATCVGSASTASGFLRNEAENVGGAVYITGADYAPLFVADGCDFGTGADDNVPTDVVTAGETQETFAWGDDASFGCDTTGCL